MLSGPSRRRGRRPRHARPSWTARVSLSPRWLAASLLVLALGGLAALLSPYPDRPAAQHTAAVASSSEASYFAPPRTAAPSPRAASTPRPLTRTVVVRTVSLHEARTPPPAAPAGSPEPAETSETAEASEAAEQSSPDRWSPEHPADRRDTPGGPAEEERCGGALIALWSDCPDGRGH